MYKKNHGILKCGLWSDKAKFFFLEIYFGNKGNFLFLKISLKNTTK